MDQRILVWFAVGLLVGAGVASTVMVALAHYYVERQFRNGEEEISEGSCEKRKADVSGSDRR